MKFDIVLPVLLFMFLTITIFVNQNLGNKIKALFNKTKLRTFDVVLFIVILGAMITAIAFLPSLAVQILYLSNLSYLLSSFTYVLFKKYYLALFPPLILLLSYFLFWNSFVFNMFALILACIIILYLHPIFSWKTLVIFAVLITILDVFHVFGTGFMGQAAEKVLELKLPVLIWLPTYPLSGFIALGLGDILFSGLLSLHVVLKTSHKAGVLTALTIAIAMFLYEIFAFNTAYFRFFPATVIVLIGWLGSISLNRLVFGYNFTSFR